MNFSGPVSVLDSGQRYTGGVVVDHLTRRQGACRPALSDLEVVYRIPQPYRTSFSARCSVERLRSHVDRRRSLSPGDSAHAFGCASDSRNSVRLGSTPARGSKRVAYDLNVKTCPSHFEEKCFAEEPNDFSTSGYQSSLACPIANNISDVAASNYSTELRILSDQIMKMNWSMNEVTPADLSPLCSTSYASARNQSPRQNVVWSDKSSANCSISVKTAADDSLGCSVPSRTPSNQLAPVSRCTVATQEDNHCQEAVRSRAATALSPTTQRGQSPAEACMHGDHALFRKEEKNGFLPIQQRSSSVSMVSDVRTSRHHSDYLVPAKRSFSISINSLFKRISPFVGRKRGKVRTCSNSTASSSRSIPGTYRSSTGEAAVNDDATSKQCGVDFSHITTSHSSSHLPVLPASTVKAGFFHCEGSPIFSRGKMRNSFIRMCTAVKKGSRAKSTSADFSRGECGVTGKSCAPGTYSTAGANRDERGKHHSSKSTLPATAERKLKQMRMSDFGKRDLYREFKDKCSPTVTVAGNCVDDKCQALKVCRIDRTDSSEDKNVTVGSFDKNSIPLKNGRCSSNGTQLEGGSLRVNLSNGVLSSEGSFRKLHPPSSLDVVPSHGNTSLKSFPFANAAFDADSIGECSFDCNLIASRTSLLSTSCLSTTAALHSRKTVRNRSPVVGTVGDGASSDMHCVQFDRISNCVTKGSHDDKSADDAFGVDTGRSLLSHNEDSENVVSHRCVPADPRRRPSYTKLSCALSGYNKYSCYSSSRDTMLRSSSSSSVSSKLQSPDRSQVTSPAGDTVNRSPQSSLAPSDGCVPSVSAGTAGSSGIDAVTTLSVPPVNGRCVPPCNNATRYPPGNAIKDGNKFLAMMSKEEAHLSMRMNRADVMMRSEDLPEEVSGRIRSAIGQSNLLIDQKFRQFRILCLRHMYPDVAEPTLLYEDLQGFWDTVNIQVDNVYDYFIEIDAMSVNGWKELPRQPSSRCSSASSSPGSGPSSHASAPSTTPGHTPGSRRRSLRVTKEASDSSPEDVVKTRSRDEARRRLLVEKRAAMRQQRQTEPPVPDIEIFLPQPGKE